MVGEVMESGQPYGCLALSHIVSPIRIVILFAFVQVYY